MPSLAPKRSRGHPARVESTAGDSLVTHDRIPPMDDSRYDRIANAVARNYDRSQDMDFLSIASVLNVARLPQETSQEYRIGDFFP